MKTAPHYPTTRLRCVTCPYCQAEFSRDSVQETSVCECRICGEQFRCVVEADGTRSTFFLPERAA